MSRGDVNGRYQLLTLGFWVTLALFLSKVLASGVFDSAWVMFLTAG